MTMTNRQQQQIIIQPDMPDCTEPRHSWGESLNYFTNEGHADIMTCSNCNWKFVQEYGRSYKSYYKLYRYSPGRKSEESPQTTRASRKSS